MHEDMLLPLSSMLPSQERPKCFVLSRCCFGVACTAPTLNRTTSFSSMHSLTAVVVFVHLVMQTGELKKKLEEVKKQMGIEE